MKEFIMMKKTKILMYAGIILAVICALVLTGCPQGEDDPQPDSRLIGEWTNGHTEPGLVKRFTIKSDYTFTAYINPTFIGAYNTAYKEARDNGADEAAAKAAGEAALTGLDTQGITDAKTRWTVTGKLTVDSEGIYIMSNLQETTDKPALNDTIPGGANTTVAGFSGNPVRITFVADNDNQFNFVSAKGDANINAFFGGYYDKVVLD
jgi:hypothetical protein